MAPSELRTLVERAWEGSVYPGDVNIAYDGEGHNLECIQVADFFRGKRWNDVTLGSLKSYRGDASACLYFMSVDAFRYYLPAYMLIALDNYAEADVVADTAVNALTPQPLGPLQKFWAERLAGFSPKQREAIVAFLRFMASEHGEDYPLHGPKDALRHWTSAV
jgi:hypothetical protein